MKRKFKFTEEQINKIMTRTMCEDMNVAYQKPANGMASTNDMKQQLYNAQKAAPGAKINLEVSAEDLNITEEKEEKKENTFSKKELKEARVKMLRENSVAYKKRDLLNKKG